MSIELAPEVENYYTAKRELIFVLVVIDRKCKLVSM